MAEKILDESPDKPPPVSMDPTEEVEKDGGPARPPVQRAVQNETPGPARAAELFSGQEPGAGASRRAELMRSVQPLGNRRSARLAQQPASRPLSTPAIQRQAKTPLEAVQEVRSLHVEENLETAVTGSANALERRMQQRKAAIEKELKALSGRNEAWARKKSDALKADLAKDLPQVLKSKDSKYVNPALREDVVAAHKALTTKQANLDKGKKEWQRYDSVFADPGVVKMLATKQFTAANLKALVAQESGDLTRTDVKGDIAGIAQMGSKEVKEVGGKPEERLDPHKAIPLAAKVLLKKATQLEAQLNPVPTGKDYKKFVFASYNAGARTVVEAQKKAKAMKRDPASWDSLVQGGANSPLYLGIKIALPRLNAPAKYQETTSYVARIFARLE